jgi:hypothetical protein
VALTLGLGFRAARDARFRIILNSAVKARLPRDGASTVNVDNFRAMRLSSGEEDSVDYVLRLLWTSIVWPVINRLGLKVCQTSATGDLR